MDTEKATKEALQAAQDNVRRKELVRQAKALHKALEAKYKNKKGAKSSPMIETPPEKPVTPHASWPMPEKTEAELEKIFGGKAGLTEARNDAAGKDFHYRKEHKDF